MATFLAPQHRGESMTDSFVISMSSTLQLPYVENNEISAAAGLAAGNTAAHGLQACESRLGRTR